MSVLGDFLSREAGQKRRQWLEEKMGGAEDALQYYLGPTGVPDRLKAVAKALEFTHIISSNPADIRSRFARFDPRLSHLRNLSAGVGGLTLANILEKYGLMEFDDETGKPMAMRPPRLGDSL